MLDVLSRVVAGWHDAGRCAVFPVTQKHDKRTPTVTKTHAAHKQETRAARKRKNDSPPLPVALRTQPPAKPSMSLDKDAKCCKTESSSYRVVRGRLRVKLQNRRSSRTGVSTDSQHSDRARRQSDQQSEHQQNTKSRGATIHIMLLQLKSVADEQVP